MSQGMLKTLDIKYVLPHVGV